MAKEWILNSAMNRFQFNFKRNVGAVSAAIRKCSPKNMKEWEDYYYKNVRSKEYIEELGKKLYVKITEVIQAEIEDITEEDCVQYMYHMVIDRTYDGYTTEISTIYKQLENILQIKISPAPDEWDRLYNVDFYIKIKDKYLGLQIKPISGVSHISQIYKEQGIQKHTHKKFTENYSGKVFYIYSIKIGKEKKIYNEEIIKDIRYEIDRLNQG